MEEITKKLKDLDTFKSDKDTFKSDKDTLCLSQGTYLALTFDIDALPAKFLPYDRKECHVTIKFYGNNIELMKQAKKCLPEDMDPVPITFFRSCHVKGPEWELSWMSAIVPKKEDEPMHATINSTGIKPFNARKGEEAVRDETNILIYKDVEYPIEVRLIESFQVFGTWNVGS